MLRQQETLYFGHVIPASYVQLQIITANQSNAASAHVKIDALAPISSGHGLLRSTRVHVVFIRNHIISNLVIDSLKFKKLLELQGKG